MTPMFIAVDDFYNSFLVVVVVGKEAVRLLTLAEKTLTPSKRVIVING